MSTRSPMLPVLDLLSETLPRLAPAEAAVARHLLEHPDDGAHGTISDLARASESSEATVVRLCKKLGFTGYLGFKMRLIRELALRVDGEYEAVDPGDSSRIIARKVFAATITSLRQTSNLVDGPLLLKAAKAIEGAPEVAAFGVGTSAYVALDTVRRLMRVGVRVSAETSGVDQRVRAALMEPNSVVIVVSASGRSAELLQAVDIAKERGARIIAFTHDPSSPLARIADILFSVAAHETAYGSEAMAARIATFVLLDALFVVLALRNNEVVEENLSRIQQVMDRTEQGWPRAARRTET
ncbi:MAG: MurR/RpiR family transcriptional regulator [Acidimicrobiales bacterium]